MGSVVKIILADDHALFRHGMRLTLGDFDPDLALAETANLDDALVEARSAPAPDLILLDIQMPGMNGLEGVRRMKETLPSTPVVIISASESFPEAKRAIELGASGFIPKSSGAEAMIRALKLVLMGGIYFPAEIALGEGSADGTDAQRVAGAAPAELPKVPAELAALSRRQWDVLKHLAQGKSNKAIARDLSLSESTIKVHVAAILRTLNVQNRTEAVIMASKLGM